MRATRLAAGAVIAVTAAVLVVATVTVFGTVEDGTAGEVAAPTVVVTEGTVGQVVPVTGRMTWAAEAHPAPGLDAGTVTANHVGTLTAVDDGDVVFHVDLEPVVAVQSATPFFLDLAVGDAGADVHELKRFLERHGYLRSAAAQAGSYTPTVDRAVGAWRTRLGGHHAGGFSRRSAIAFATLPAQASSPLPVGAAADPEAGVRRWAERPTFTISVGGSLRDRVAVGTSVTVTVAGQQVDMTVSNVTTGVDPSNPVEQAVVAVLAPADPSAPLCDPCPIPGDDEGIVFQARVTVVEPTSGPVVPSSALAVDDTGQATVVLADSGREVPVTVVAEADGRAVVTGVEPGTRLLALGIP